jgi:HSP20 family protein
MRTLLPTLRSTRLFDWPEANLLDCFLDDFRAPALSMNDNSWIPDIDIKENEKEILVRAEVPGIDKKDIDITMSEGLLTIRGEKRHDDEVKREDYHRVESRYGSFSRSFRLPVEIVNDKIEANYKDGVLSIVLPKADAPAPKKIEVKS